MGFWIFMLIMDLLLPFSEKIFFFFSKTVPIYTPYFSY